MLDNRRGDGRDGHPRPHPRRRPLDLFGTPGVDAVSLDEIAADVGVRKQTVLYWFASKDELVDAVLEATAAELAVVIDAALGQRPTTRWSASTPSCGRCSGLAVRRPALLGLVRELSRLRRRRRPTGCASTSTR